MIDKSKSPSTLTMVLMPLLALIVLVMSCVGAVLLEGKADTNSPIFTVLPLSTNRVTNIVRTLKTEPVSGPCPECGQPNHHDRRVDYLAACDMIYLSLKTSFGTNVTLVGCGPTNYWIATNLFLRPIVGRTQPGFQPPPLPR